jgi:hypothetical protein
MSAHVSIGGKLVLESIFESMLQREVILRRSTETQGRYAAVEAAGDDESWMEITEKLQEQVINFYMPSVFIMNSSLSFSLFLNIFKSTSSSTLKLVCTGRG